MKLGLWALPAYGILLALSTLTHQPSIDDFDAYARYVTTDTFLLSHLGASILGAALAILGTAAATTYLRSKLPFVLTVVANVFLAATFGSAAFVQPGLGRAHLAGVPGMPALNDDTAYGPALFATALSASFLLIVAATALGTAIARTSRSLRAPGLAYGVLLSLFVVSGFAFSAVQAYLGFAFALATAVLAIRLPRTTSSPGPVLTTV
ncbi:hypothetical protein [Paractinoplanes lichenicola]|uniref:DUF998 domain-containing protein n=1 Tax=Paractinoplanes lichenicola TaxID=2802976 RepID=A0ABS1VYZ4_9ACTN|nr:hypothetical protein [Actinoplanes lichenicola]MBL7259717.1 hypothetical protein [Actinoplanes lichenicola]